MFAYRLQDAVVATEGPFRGGAEGTTLPTGQKENALCRKIWSHIPSLFRRVPPHRGRGVPKNSYALQDAVVATEGTPFIGEGPKVRHCPWAEKKRSLSEKFSFARHTRKKDIRMLCLVLQSQDSYSQFACVCCASQTPLHAFHHDYQTRRQRQQIRSRHLADGLYRNAEI